MLVKLLWRPLRASLDKLLTRRVVVHALLGFASGLPFYLLRNTLFTWFGSLGVDKRDALAFVIENTFRDDAFGLNSDLLNRMTVDKWMDRRRFGSSGEPTWPIHDRIMGVQSSTLTQLMNPTTRRTWASQWVSFAG